MPQTKIDPVMQDKIVAAVIADNYTLIRKLVIEVRITSTSVYCCVNFVLYGRIEKTRR